MHARCRAERCAARGERTCARAGMRCMLSASTARARQGQGKGGCRTYGRSERLASIGWRRRWPVGVDGEAATAGLPPKPRSPWACAWSASARGRGKVRCRVCGGWQVGSWGSSWAAAHRRLGVGSGESKREGDRAILQRLPRVSPSLVSTSYRTKGI
jgi:hypothetical protein